MHPRDDNRATARDDRSGQPSAEGFRPAPPSLGGEEPGWTFVLSDDLQTVTAATMSYGEVTQTLDISDVSFTTMLETNDLGEEAVVAINELHADTRGVQITLFNDQDGDGVFTRALDLSVATDTEHQPSTVFIFAEDGSVAVEQSASLSGKWHGEGRDSQAVYEVVTLDDDSYVVKTEAHGDRYDFEVFRDDDGDGAWSVVATGHADATMIDASTQAVNFDEIELYFASASITTG